MSSSSCDFTNPDLSVDEFYFSALYDEDDIFPISDERYAEQISLQEALMSSSSTNMNKNNNNATPSRNIDNNNNGKGKIVDTGESSRTFQNNNNMFFCDICMDSKLMGEMFFNNNNNNNITCGHVFCTLCMGSYVASKIQENISTVKCPDPKCSLVLDPTSFRGIIPDDVFGRWENALCENVVLGFGKSQRFYCPFKDCSAMMVVDEEDEAVVTSSECPNCRRLFCAQCRVTWHADMACEEFQRLKKEGMEDVMMMELAKNKMWRRCPKCRFFVEKVDGCTHISCRCGNHFCYSCGRDWNSLHSCNDLLSDFH